MYELLVHAHPYSEFQRVKTTIDPQTEKTFQRLARCFSSNPGFGHRFVALAALVTGNYTVSYNHDKFADVPEARAILQKMLAPLNERASCSELLLAALFMDWAKRHTEENRTSSSSWGQIPGLRRISLYFGSEDQAAAD